MSVAYFQTPGDAKSRQYNSGLTISKKPYLTEPSIGNSTDKASSVINLSYLVTATMSHIFRDHI